MYFLSSPAYERSLGESDGTRQKRRLKTVRLNRLQNKSEIFLILFRISNIFLYLKFSLQGKRIVLPSVGKFMKYEPNSQSWPRNSMSSLVLEKKIFKK